MNKIIYIPSDVVLKVCISDLYDESGEPITISDTSKVELTFTSGGASKSFVLDMDDSATLPEGVSIVTKETNANEETDVDPYIVICLCTQGLLPGQLALRSDVSIPDTRFHEGVRHEVDEYLFPVILK